MYKYLKEKNTPRARNGRRPSCVSCRQTFLHQNFTLFFILYMFNIYIFYNKKSMFLNYFLMKILDDILTLLYTFVHKNYNWTFSKMPG